MTELIRGVINNTSFRVNRSNCTFDVLKPELCDDATKTWGPLDRKEGVSVVYWVKKGLDTDLKVIPFETH